MALRLLRCVLSEVPKFHANLFLEPHVVAFVAVVGRYSHSPARFHVECGNMVSRWLGNRAECWLEISWQEDTAEKAARLRLTMQSGPLVELASVALALILASRIVPLGPLDVTEYGGRADYRARRRKAVLEISGTEVPAELGRRHREKVLQAQDNPFGWDAYVAVCAFSAEGHRIRFTRHAFEEPNRGEG